MSLPSGKVALRALVVDDNTDTAGSTGELLALHGFDARVATTGRDAIRLARAEPPDAILLDLSMPIVDGFEVARQICEACDVAHARRPLLVAVTGHGSDDDRARTKAAGFDLHLTKPVAPALLVAVLRQHEQRLDSDGSSAK
jgi:two-component system, OmpR family, response regulator